MKNIQFIALSVIFSLICLNILPNNVEAETSDTYTIVLEGSSLGSTSALNITIALTGAQLDTGVTFKANGASQLLTDVNTTTGIATVVWSGTISDGKATITGKIKAGSVTGTPSISITKVEAAGGVNITTQLTKITATVNSSASPETSPSPSPTPTSSPSPTPSPTPSSTPEPTEPSVTITVPDEVKLKARGLNIFKITVKASNFAKSSRCEIDTAFESTEDITARARPATFILSSVRPKKSILIQLPRSLTRDLIENELEDTLFIDVNCSNGATGEEGVLLTP